MRVLIAVVMGLAIGAVGLGMLRSIAARAPRSVGEIAAPPAGVRVTYWCRECGTEVLLLRAGSEAAPRHCGEAMVRREEVAGE